MFSQLKKRKKTTFNNYKAVRTSIHLNNTTSDTLNENTLQHNLLNNWEYQWIEQLNELNKETTIPTALSNKHSKLITKWWENN